MSILTNIGSNISGLHRYAHRPAVHVASVLVFLLAVAVGYRYGGYAFVESWGGSLAAVISTAFLIYKSQGYWFWMMVNAGLWVALFFNDGLPVLAWLQVSFLVLSLGGMIQWALVKRGIGVDFSRRSDLLFTLASTIVFFITAYAYWPDEVTRWWALEIGAVVTALLAIWSDAFRYKGNWIAWTASNCCSWPLFAHTGLWGPFVANFIYQGLNFVGYYQWWKEERSLRAERSPALGTRHLPVLDSEQT